MAGKDYKVQKKAKDQQRLSVFQPAFRWGGSSASATSSTSSSIFNVEAQKDDKFESRNQGVGPRRQDKLNGTKNERVEHRRNDNRLAVKDDLDAKMARDAKRMTTFQPIFGSLFSSKASSKDKSLEPSQAQRPPVNGFPPQQPPSSRGEPSRYAFANNAPGSSRDGRTGPGKSPNGLRIDTKQSRGKDRRRDDAASNRSGRGAMPRSPLQRNPPSPMPEDQGMPLGISNAFGPRGGSKATAVAVSSVPANSADPRSTRNVRPHGQDRSMAPDAASGWAGGREASSTPGQKIIGVDISRHPAVQRNMTGNDFHRQILGAENQVRLVDTPKRKPVVPEKATKFDSRTQQQPEPRGQLSTQPTSRPGARRQDLPQLIITDTSDASQSTYPSHSQPSQNNPYSRETQSITSSVPSRAQAPPAVSPATRSLSRSPLEQESASASSSTTRTTRDASPSPFPDDARKPALPKQVTARDGGAKRSQSPLRVFPKQQPPQTPEGLGIQSETSKWKTWSPVRPALHREESPRVPEQTRGIPSAQAIALSETRPSKGNSGRFASFDEPVGASRALPGQSNTPLTPAPQPTSTTRGPSHISTRSVDIARSFENTQRQDPQSEGTRFSPSHRMNRSETSARPVMAEKPERSSPGPSFRTWDATRQDEALRTNKPFEPSPLSSTYESSSKDQFPVVQVSRVGDVRRDWPSRTLERSRDRKNDGSPMSPAAQKPEETPNSSKASGSRHPKQKSVDLVSESDILKPLRSKFSDKKQGASGSTSAEHEGNLRNERGVKTSESRPTFSARSQDPAYLPSPPSNISNAAPQNELFLEVSKPTQPSTTSPTSITTPIKPSEATSNTSSAHDVKPHKAGGSSLPTNRPPLAMRSITERTEPDAYEFIPVVAHISPKFGAGSSVAGQAEVPPSRTAGLSIMDRPRGVVKQRPSRTDSNTPLGARSTNESSTKPDNAPSRTKGRVPTEQAGIPEELRSANVSRGRPDADQNGRGVELPSRKVQWTDRPRDLIVEKSASSTTQSDVAHDSPPAFPEFHAQKSALLGRWVGKGKTPERKNSSPAPELADAASHQTSGLIRLAGNGETELDQPQPQSSKQVGNEQRFGEMPGRRIVKEPQAAGAKPTQRPGLKHRGPTIDAAPSAGSRPVDIKGSDVTSPQPTEEDFFKQMRQSVMFQNIEPAGKMDLSAPTDASVKRKSRRNRNISISGLQPGHDVPVPELPKISHAHAWSTSTSGDEAFSSAVPQLAAETPSSARGILEESRTPVVVEHKVSRDDTQPSSSNPAPFAPPPSIRPGVDTEEAFPDRNAASKHPLRRQVARDDEIPRGLFLDSKDASREEKNTTRRLPYTVARPEILTPVDDLSQGKAADIAARGSGNMRSDKIRGSGASDSVSVVASPAIPTQLHEVEKIAAKSSLVSTHAQQTSFLASTTVPTHTIFAPENSSGKASAKSIEPPLSRDGLPVSSPGSPDVPLLEIEDKMVPAASQEKAAQFSSLKADHPRNMSPASQESSSPKPMSSRRLDEGTSMSTIQAGQVHASAPAVEQASRIALSSPDLPKRRGIVEQTPVMQTAQVGPQVMETAPDRTPSSLLIHDIIERATPSVESMPNKDQARIQDRTGGPGMTPRHDSIEVHSQPAQLQSSQDRDAILSSIHSPQAVEHAASSQNPNEDITDHIMSLYDGSDYLAPDHKSTGGFPDNRSATHSTDAGSLRGIESPADSRQFSVFSTEATDREAPRSPVHSVLETFLPNSSAGSPAAKDRDARPPPLATTRSIHSGVLSDQGHENVPPAEPDLENTSGAEHLRKMNGSEGMRDNHAVPPNVSKTPVYSPAAFDGTSMSQFGDGTISRAVRSPETRPDALTDHRNTHHPQYYATPETHITPSAWIPLETNDVRSESSFDRILLNEAGPATFGSRTFSPEIVASSPRTAANANIIYEPFSTDLASPPFGSRSSTANLQCSWTPRQVNDVATRPLSPEANSVLSSPQQVEGTYSGSNVLAHQLFSGLTSSHYPDERANKVSSRDLSSDSSVDTDQTVPSHRQSTFSTSPPAFGAQAPSPRSVATAEKPVREPLPQPDDVKDHIGNDNPSEQVLSPGLDHRFESGRTLSPNCDAGQTSPRPALSMCQLDDIPAGLTHSVASDDHTTKIVSRPTSFTPETGYSPDPLRTAQGLGNNLETRSCGAEVVRGSQCSPMSTYNTVSSATQSEDETRNKNCHHSRMSTLAPTHEPETALAIESPSAQQQDEWDDRDNIIRVESTRPDSADCVSTPIASPDLEMHDDWPSDHTGAMQTAPSESPRSSSTGLLDTHEYLAPGSSVDESMTDGPSEAGRHSPGRDSVYGHSDESLFVGGHDRDHASSAVYGAGVSPDMTHGSRPDHSSVGHLNDSPIDAFTAASYQGDAHEHGNVPRDSTPGVGYQAGTGELRSGSFPVDHVQGDSGAFDSDTASYSSLAENGQPTGNGRGSALDEYAPIAHHRDTSPAYSDNDGEFPSGAYQPSAAAFDNLQSDARHMGNYYNDALPFDDRGDDFPADNYQPSAHGLDDAQADHLPVDNHQSDSLTLNDHEGSFTDDGYRSGAAGLDSLSADDLPINDYPESHILVDGPFLDSHTSNEFAGQTGGFDAVASPDHPADDYHGGVPAFEGLPAGDYTDSYPPASSPVMDSYPSDNLAGQVDVFETGPNSDYPADDYHGGAAELDSLAADDFQGNPAPVGGTLMDSYPAGDNSSEPSGLGGAEMETLPPRNTPNYDGELAGSPPGDFSSGHFEDNIDDTFDPKDEVPSADGNEAFAPAHDGAPYEGVPLSDAGSDRDSDPVDEPSPPSSEQEADVDYPTDDVAVFAPAHDDAPREEAPFSDAGSDKDIDIGPGSDHMEYPDNGEQCVENDIPHDELRVDDQEGMESLIESPVANPDTHSAGEESDGQIHDANDNDDLVDYDPVETDNYESAGDSDVEGENMGHEAQPCDAGWVDGEVDDEQVHGDAGEYPMNESGEASMGSEAEEYLLGGPGDVPTDGVDRGDDFALGGEADGFRPGNVDDSPPMNESDNYVLGGEAEDYLLGGEEEPSMDSVEDDEPPREDGDEELPIGDMYVGEERSMSPDEEEDENPVGEGEEIPMVQEEEGYPVDEQDDLLLEDDESEGSDCGMDEYDGEQQLGEEMLEDGSEVEEENHSQLDESSVDERGLNDDENQGDIGDVDQASDCDELSDIEVASDGEGETEVENRDLASSDVDELESQGDLLSDLLEDNGGEEDEPSIDDLDDAEAPATPASPTLTEADREVTTPIPITTPLEDEQDDDSIFPDTAPQQDLPDLENAAPVRLSTLYTQDLGLDFLPAAPTSPQAAAAFETGSEQEEEEIAPDPVRFSALYRSSLALESFMWEDEEDSISEVDDEQQIVASPLTESAEGPATETDQQALQALEVGQGQPPTAAISPLSPRPLATPPPDLHHGSEDRDTSQQNELSKDFGEHFDQQNASSPRLQPTPPPESARASSPSESDEGDRRDSKGPRTFDEMNLPQRVISPPNTGDEQEVAEQAPAYGGRRSISQRVSGWLTGGASGSSGGQGRARPPPMPPTPYDSRYGEQESL